MSRVEGKMSSVEGKMSRVIFLLIFSAFPFPQYFRGFPQHFHSRVFHLKVIEFLSSFCNKFSRLSHKTVAEIIKVPVLANLR